MAVRKKYYFITWVEEETLAIGYAEESCQFDLGVNTLSYLHLTCHIWDNEAI